MHYDLKQFYQANNGDITEAGSLDATPIRDRS